jgi:hypothetical protein
MCIWLILLIALMLQSRRLLNMLRDRYPQIAAQEVPEVLQHGRHPEKAIFFFRKRAVVALRPHPDIWRERQRYVGLVIVMLAFLLVLGISLVTMAILLT